MDNEQDRTVFVEGIGSGGIAKQITNALLVELFMQVTIRTGPLERCVLMERKGRGGGCAPVKDDDVCDDDEKVDADLHRFAFVTYKHSESVMFTCDVLRDTKLHDCALKIQPRSGSKHDGAFRQLRNSRDRNRYGDAGRDGGRGEHDRRPDYNRTQHHLQPQQQQQQHYSPQQQQQQQHYAQQQHMMMTPPAAWPSQRMPYIPQAPYSNPELHAMQGRSAPMMNLNAALNGYNQQAVGRWQESQRGQQRYNPYDNQRQQHDHRGRDHYRNQQGSYPDRSRSRR